MKRLIAAWLIVVLASAGISAGFGFYRKVSLRQCGWQCWPKI